MVSRFSLLTKSQESKLRFLSCQKYFFEHITVTVLSKMFPLMQSHHRLSSRQCSCESLLALTSVFCGKHNSCLISSQWPLMQGWGRWKVSAFNRCPSRGGRSRRLVSTYLFTWYYLPCPSEGFLSRYITWLHLQEQTLNAENPVRGVREWDFALCPMQLSSKKVNLFKKSTEALK